MTNIDSAQLKQEESTYQKEGPYSLLRRDIIELKLKPGMIISIKELCDYYKSSRSPMRDILLRLEQEGLVTFLPQRGIMISKIDFKRVKEERFLRISVESQVMRCFMRKHTAEDIACLEKSLERQNEYIKAKEFRKFLAEDDYFHNKFYLAVNMSWSADVVNSVSGNYRRVRLLSIINRSISDNILSQHREMLDAINKNDEQRLLDLFNRHLTKLDKEEPEFIKKFPDLCVAASLEERRDPVLRNDFLVSLVNERC